MSRSDSPKRRRAEKSHRSLAHCRESGGKVQYPKRKQALTAMNFTASLESRTVKPQAVYRCRFCGDWHMTSKPPR